MSVGDFSLLARYVGVQLGLIEPTVLLGKATKVIKDQAACWNPGSESSSQVHHDRFAVTPLIEKTLAKFTEGVDGSVAVVLGARNVGSVLCLLNKKWKVIVVDKHENLLTELKQSLSEQIKIRLETVHTSIESYSFPENIQLIFAYDVLPYCNPDSFSNIWEKAQASLAPDGRIAGCLFSLPENDREKGAWFIEKNVVAPFLRCPFYEQELLGYDKYWFQCDPRRIEFIGRKTLALSKKD